MQKIQTLRGFAIVAISALLVSAPAQAYTILAGPGSFSGSAVTLDFETLALGTNVTNQFQSVGAAFSSVNGTGLPTIDLNESGGGQGINGGPADPTIYTNIAQDAPLLLTFVDPVSGNPTGVTAAAGAFYIDVAPFIGQGFFFDMNGVQVARFVLDQEIDFWGLAADPGDALIGSILFDSSGGYPETSFGADVSESFTVDNIIFEPVSVIPEPSALTLFAVGSLVLGGYLSRSGKRSRGSSRTRP